MSMNDEFYTPQEVAKLLKISYMTVYRWIKSGKLPSYQVEKQFRVKNTDFNAFIESYKKHEQTN